jgi:hypothetical protein
VPLPGLDSIIGKVPDGFKIWKVLMRSDQHDVVAVVTNSQSYPIILCRPGKRGAWWPEEGDTAYATIYDVAFHEGNLYGITHDRELVRLGLGEDDSGIPTVTSVGCVIEYMPGEDDSGIPTVTSVGHVIEYMPDDDEEEANNDEEEAEYSDISSFDEEDYNDGEAVDYNEAPSGLHAGDEEAFGVNGEFEHDDNFFNNDDHEDVSSNDDDHTVDGLDVYEDNDDDFGYYEGDGGLIPDACEWEVCEDCYYECDGDMPREQMEHIFTTRYLIEANGKLLMLRRREHTQDLSDNYTLDVEVLEAHISVGAGGGGGAWVPTDMTGTLYVSSLHSKYVYGVSDEDDDRLAWYFADEHDVTDPESQTSHGIDWSMSTWYFPQELVV